MLIDILNMLADGSTETISIDFFKWAALGLTAAIVALAKAYQSLSKGKAVALQKLNDDILELTKSVKDEVAEVHKEYKQSISEIVEKKEAVIEMWRTMKENSDGESFDKITGLLKHQTKLALSHQKYSDKMISIMQEVVDKLDDIEPLLGLLRELLNDNVDIIPILENIKRLMEEANNDS